MRVSARILLVGCVLLLFGFFKTPAFAQTPQQTATATTQTANTTNNFLKPNVDSNVPANHHEYTQIVVIDVLSAIMCQLTGIDPTNPQQPCLGVNPTTGKIGMPPTSHTFGQAANSQPQVGGALGLMAGYVSDLYVPAVSSSQYVSYLASNFGIVKPSYAAGASSTGGNCNTSPFGYGFCGLLPIFLLWKAVEDFAYALLTVLFIVIGIGVMLRFRIDPRTVMTLQNQIPRVIIAILLITFSYAIAGAMVDLMWTATYAGINFITSTTNAQVAVTCGRGGTVPLSQAAEETLLDQPISFADRVFTKDCNGSHNGLFTVADGVSQAFGDLITQVISSLLNININGGCGLFNITGCIADFFLWLTEQIVKLIIIIAILVALFRLWFELIKSYVTFLIFVIMAPLWIVFGLIPGRPLGFEKWFRIIFANLAGFPLAAFMIVFARVLVDAASNNGVLGAATKAGAHASSVLATATTPGSNPQNIFIPPLVGNPNVTTFVYFLALGAIMIAPTIPGMIKDRMKATGQGKYGATVAAGLGAAAGAATAPGRKVWENLNRRDQFGRPEGSLAIMKQKAYGKVPFVGRYALGRRMFLERQRRGEDVGDLSMRKAWSEGKAVKQQQQKTRDQRRAERSYKSNIKAGQENTGGRWWRRGRGGNDGSSSGGSTPPPSPQGGTSS